MELVNLYTRTDITGISAVLFKEKITQFSDEMEYGEKPAIFEDGFLRMEMDYRDSANYRIGVTFALDSEGRIFVGEPDWNADEEEDRILFWERVYGLFDVLTPMSVYE